MEPIALKEKAVFVGVLRPGTDPALSTNTWTSLHFWPILPVLQRRRFIQKMDKPHSGTYLGSGKLEELSAYIKTEEVDIAVFDDELSPSQLRNLEKALSVKILDRTNLILDIFAQRAKTAYAKTQVELAQYQYLLPRLTACGPTSKAARRYRNARSGNRSLKRTDVLSSTKLPH